MNINLMRHLTAVEYHLLINTTFGSMVGFEKRYPKRICSNVEHDVSHETVSSHRHYLCLEFAIR